MKQILSSFRDFIRKDYSINTYGLVFLFLTASIAVNYFDNQGEGLIPSQRESPAFQFLSYLLLFSAAYYGVLAIYYWLENVNYFSNAKIMVISFVALLLLSFDVTFTVPSGWFQSYFSAPNSESVFMTKLLNQAFPTLICLPVLYFMSTKFSENSKNFYGLSSRGFHWKPYFTMLLFMIPLLVWASFQKDFTDQYPFYKVWKYESAFGLSQAQQFSLYEFFYLLSFINVEVLFRGLLVIGMLNYMGNKAILPMITIYAFLHFGKPIEETISAVFGGYILGVVACQSQSILGGLFIHFSIAFLMDMLAIGQRYL